MQLAKYRLLYGHDCSCTFYDAGEYDFDPTLGYYRLQKDHHFLLLWHSRYTVELIRGHSICFVTVYFVSSAKMFAVNFIFYFFSMRQTLRQIVAVLALGGIALSLVPNALAASYTDLSAANKLASANIIVDKSATPAAYRLGETLLRQEGVGTAGKALGIIPMTPVSDYTCAGKFSDVSEAWVCRAAELAAKAGLTNASNAMFRPKDNLTKYEAMLFALRSSCTVPTDKSVSGVANFAAEAGIITNAASFNGTAAATRGEFFRYVATAMEDSACGDTTDEDVLCTLFPALCEDDTDPTPSTGDVEVSATNSSANSNHYIYKNEAGAILGEFKFTGDGTVTSLELMKLGNSTNASLTNVYLYDGATRLTDAASVITGGYIRFNKPNGLFTVDGSKTITVRADIANTADASGTVIISVSSLTLFGDTATSISGVTGGELSFQSVNTASVSMSANTVSASSPNSGQMQYPIFRAPLTVTGQNVTLHAVTFKYIGSAPYDAIANAKLFVAGVNVGDIASVNQNGYLVYDLSNSPVKINSGNEIEVRADLVKGASLSFSLSIENTADLMLRDSQVNVGIAASGIPNSAGLISIGTGTLTVSTNNTVGSTKVLSGATNVAIGKYKLQAFGTDIKVLNLTALPSVTGSSNATATASTLTGTGAATIGTGGSGYTSIPAVTVAGTIVSAGTTATAVSNATGTVATMSSFGSGYTSAPTVTVTGGTCTTAPTATAFVSGGVVTGIALSGANTCTVAPTLTVAAPPAPVAGCTSLPTAVAAVSGGVVTSVTLTPTGTCYATPGLTLTVAAPPVAAVSGLSNLALYVGETAATMQQVGSSTNWTSGNYTFTLGSSLIIPAGKTYLLEVRSDIKGSNGTNYASGTIKADLVAGTNNYQAVNTSVQTTGGTSGATATSLTIDPAVLSFGATAGIVYAKQSINTSNVLIGSFTMQNNGTEKVRVTSLNTGLTLGGALVLTDVVNLRTDVAGASTIGTPTLTNNVFSTNFEIAAGATVVVKVYADLNNDTGTIATTMTPSATAVSGGQSLTIASATSPITTIISGTILASNVIVTTPTVTAQYVIGGLSSSIANFKIVSPDVDATVSKLVFTLGTAGTVNSVSIAGCGTGSPVGTTITVTCTTPMAVANGNAGKTFAVSPTYGIVAVGGVVSGTTTTLTLNQIEYSTGNQTIVLPILANNVSNAMTLVGTKPNVTLLATANPAGVGVGVKELAKVKISADAGTVALSSLSVDLAASGNISV